ncbi:cytidine deaminase family protein [Knoellia koreensis]|uniref:Cytidine deaminase n=1 Tax=Knoellia koreensis TaxID=2730921 RepID=A0A849HEF4_9MICO|nr:cytidine deaminase [Knoellia sp. DB2414S]NNM48126.1 cytidine deaminase [Knoellia sp. DB2414S]
MPITDEELIAAAAQALNPRQLADGSWVADVGAALEAVDGQIFTGASIGGYLAVCAEQSAFTQLVSTTSPRIRRVVAVWRDPADGVLHVLPPCGRCREFMRVLDQANLDAQVILGPDHTRSLAELLPLPGWHAEAVERSRG